MIDYPEGWYIHKRDYHFASRFYLRCGFPLRFADYSNIRNQILYGTARCCKTKRHNFRLLAFRVKIKHPIRNGYKRIIVVWDSQREIPVSVSSNLKQKDLVSKEPNPYLRETEEN